MTGAVFNVDNRGAYVDIGAKASAFMPAAEAAIVKIDDVRTLSLRGIEHALNPAQLARAMGVGRPVGVRCVRLVQVVSNGITGVCV